jgi:phage N-6-adenine-methyltransferase
MSYMKHPEPSPDDQGWTRDDWCTPQWVLDPIHDFAGGSIGLDPCHNSTSGVQAQKVLTKADNSLVQSWAGYGMAFVNPPYSRKLFIPFSAKIVEEANKGVEIIALVPTNCETKAWQDYLWQADAICFLNKRVKFLKNGMEQGSPAGGNALAYFGKNAERFAAKFDAELQLGKVIVL